MIIDHIDVLDRALVARSFPALSPWWRETIASFYGSTKRQLVLRVGRRGGKSTSLSRVAVIEGLYGQHEIPPGDVGVVAFLSTTRDEAAQRLRTIRAILDALSVKYRPVEGGVELTGRPIVFKVYTASISGVSGFTCICAVCDEVSSRATSTVEAIPRPKSWRLAPDLGDDGEREDLPFKLADGSDGCARQGVRRRGQRLPANRVRADVDRESQYSAEASTHALEPDEDRWRREYKAIPFEGDEMSLLSSALIDRATRDVSGDLPREDGVRYFAAMDPALTRNAWSFCVTAQRIVDGRVKRSVVAVREWRGNRIKNLEPDVVLRDVAAVCRAYSVKVVFTDQFHGQSLAVIARRDDIALRLVVVTATAPEKAERYESLLTWMSDGEIDLPPDPRLRADLLAVRRVLTPNGFTIRLLETPDGRHADLASAVSLGLMHATIPPKAPAPTLTPEARYKLEAERHIDRINKQQFRRLNPGAAGDVWDGRDVAFIGRTSFGGDND